MGQEQFLSLLDKFNLLLPFKNHLAKALLLAGGLLAIWLVLALVSGELNELTSDYATPALIAMIAYFDFMEPYIGDRVRSVPSESLKKIEVKKHEVNRDELLRKIFSNKIRGAFGIFTAFCMFLSIVFLFIGHVWYSSPLMIGFVSALGLIVAFIIGDAVGGTLIIVFNVYKIGINITHVDIFDRRQISALKSLGNWCLLVAGIGGAISALAFPALFFAPWHGETPFISSWGKLLIFGEIPILVSLFMVPLASLHVALVKSKAEHLEILYKGYRQVHEKFMPIIDSKSMDEIIAESARLNSVFANINVVLNLIDETPDWPWDPIAFQTLVVTIVASVVSFGLFQVI